MFPKTIEYEFKRTNNKQGHYHIQIRFDGGPPAGVYEWNYKPTKEQIKDMLNTVESCFRVYHDSMCLPTFQNAKNIYTNEVDGPVREKEIRTNNNFFQHVLNSQQKTTQENLDDILERRNEKIKVEPKVDFNIGDSIVVVQSEHPERIGMVAKISDIHNSWYYVMIDGQEVRYRKESIKKAEKNPVFKKGDIVWAKLSNVTSSRSYIGQIVEFDQIKSCYYIKGANEIIPLKESEILKKIDNKPSIGKKLKVGDIVFLKSRTRLKYAQFFGMVDQEISPKEYLIHFGEGFEDNMYHEKFLTKIYK